MRYFSLYFTYLKMAIQSRLAYKADALLGIISFATSNIANLLTVFLMLELVPSIEGYTFANLMFLYGVLLIPKGIDHVFTDAIWQIGFSYVAKGEMDKYMIKPVNVLFQIIAEWFQPEGFGEIVLGTALIAVYLPMQSIAWSFANVSGLLVCLFFAIFVFTAIKLVSASPAFWFKRCGQIMVGMYEMSDFARYPVQIFGNALKTVLLYIIPFALVGYMPVHYLLNGLNIWTLVPQIALVTVVLCMVSYLVFRLGLRRYESAGS